MRKRIAGAALVVSVLCLAPAACATGWGVGGFGGVSIPIVQDDAGRGYVAGAHLRLSLGGLLGIEPNFTYFRDGDWTFENQGELIYDGKGSKVSAFGVNVILGGAGPLTGFRFFPFVGAKFYNQSTPGLDSETQVGWNAGLGLEIGIGKIGIEARAAGELMKMKDKGSRKWAHVTGGLNYYFGAK
jgi:hypothetical protein